MTTKSVKEITYTKIRWDEKGLPHSTAFDDKYFCQDNGYDESQYIFCGGNQLKERFENLSAQDSNSFVIAETGFGTGLNFLCAWQLFEQCAPTAAKLHYISLDQFPLSADDLIKALNLWPQLQEYSTQLTVQYPNINIESQHIIFVGGRIKLTLIFDHVLSALAQMRQASYAVDAWFLDGFGPSKNPEMWSPEVFEQMAALSRAGTTVATFTVAGHVRRGLAQKGFSMTKTKGFGRKHQMLQGIYAAKKIADV